MKKFVAFMIVFLIVVGVALIATRPDKMAHYAAIRNVAMAVVNAEMNQKEHDETLAAIGAMEGVAAVDNYLSMNLIVRDYTLYSVVYIINNQDPRMVSVGLFKHVFTIKEEDAKRMLKSKLSLPNIKKQQKELMKYEGM